VILPSGATMTFGLKIKKKLRNMILRARIQSAPSPVQYAREGIFSHLNRVCPQINLEILKIEYMFELIVTLTES
jgi:hypothetical protein